MRRFSPWLKMIRYSSEWFQVWYQDICYVALAAGPTLEFSFFSQTCPNASNDEHDVANLTG